MPVKASSRTAGSFSLAFEFIGKDTVFAYAGRPAVHALKRFGTDAVVFAFKRFGKKKSFISAPSSPRSAGAADRSGDGRAFQD